ncbi:hypothetical protein BDW68DRAFT_111922 [Aspergillus falconensis]
MGSWTVIRRLIYGNHHYYYGLDWTGLLDCGYFPGASRQVSKCGFVQEHHGFTADPQSGPQEEFSPGD